ncbi:MAG: MFS transporter [Acidilobus sp.]
MKATERSGFPWATFVALSMGMIVYGLAESYGPVSDASGIVPPRYAWLGYSLPFIFGGVGALLAGYLTDRLGRRRAFLVTSALIVIGLLLYVPIYLNLVSSSNALPLLVASMALVGMAAIGLETPVLVAIAESTSPSYRSKLLVLAPNFGNLGVALAFVPLIIMHGQGALTAQTEVALLLMYLAPVAALVIAWLKASESLPWLALKNGTLRVDEAWRQVDGGAQPVVPTTGLRARLATLLALGISQDVAFVYITYGVAGAFLPSATLFGLQATTLIPMVGGFLMTAVGVLTGLFISGKMERRSFALLSFSLQAVLWAALAAALYASGLTLNALVLLLFALNFIPLELTWAARALLEPELFPTNVRGLYVSVVRASVWIVTGLITGLLTYVPQLATEFVPAAVTMGIVAVIGAGAAAAWKIFGFETGNRSLLGLDLHHMGVTAVGDSGEKGK